MTGDDQSRTGVIGWEAAPQELRAQVDGLVRALRAAGELVGVYLHGSLALGCFNEARSDVDVLVVAAQPLEAEAKLELVDALLHLSAAPHAIELHVLTRAGLDPWRHPAPFDLHYGESHRQELARDPVGALTRQAPEDPDLAAHVSVARSAGIALVGPPAAEVFPAVPPGDLADSLLRDLEFARTVRSALYAVLSPCRVWATLATGEVHSKASGAAWALERLPLRLRPPVEHALASYTSAGEPIELSDADRCELHHYVEERACSIVAS